MTLGVCTTLWSADGNYNWSADGYPGISADGYEPTPLECAVTALAAVGVNVGQLTYEYSAYGVPAGWVITGYVPYINAAYAGQYIPLVISLGPAPAPKVLTVPNVVGMFYYDAQLALLDAGFLIGQPLWALSGTVLPQYVISQSLPAGRQVTTQTQVLITVAGFPVVNQPGIIVPVP
jgi:beta-lactam-binding protein with PASTA domain